MWERWNRDETREFVEATTQSDERLIIFISKFISESKSFSMGSYGVSISYRFDYEGLNKFIDIETVENRIDKRFIGNDLSELSAKEKFGVEKILKRDYRNNKKYF